MDLISVIVPVFNVEKYLYHCVESIVNQTYQNLEIILVDDGSPDACPALCDEWARKDDRIKVIHKQNGGLSDARNAGLACAEGKYIAFVDSDDWVEPNYIEYLYHAIISTNSELAACDIQNVADEETVMPISEKIGRIKRCTSEEAINCILCDCDFRAVAWNKLYSAELLQGEKFEVGRLHEDEFFSYRIYDKCHSLAFVDNRLYNYRQRQGSIMTSFSMQHLDVLEAYFARLQLLEIKYPDLYVKDKIIFCTSCVNLYCKIITQCGEQQKKAQERIKSIRKRIHFSLGEIFQYSFRDCVYIVGSAPSIIYLFSKIRIWRGYR